MSYAQLIWHNGSIKPWHEATVHVSAHALHYGSSVFEGERVYATPRGPCYFRLDDHTHRLFESARLYDIEVGYSEEEINAACRELRGQAVSTDIIEAAALAVLEIVNRIEHNSQKAAMQMQRAANAR